MQEVDRWLEDGGTNGVLWSIKEKPQGVSHINLVSGDPYHITSIRQKNMRLYKHIYTYTHAKCFNIQV